MTYKKDLYDYLFKVIIEHFYDTDRFNYYSEESSVYNENTHQLIPITEYENDNLKMKSVVYQQIENFYGDFITTNTETIDFQIINSGEDNIFDFNLEVIKINASYIGPEEIGLKNLYIRNNLFEHNENKQHLFIEEAIEIFVKEKRSQAEKNILLQSVNEENIKHESNRKRM